MKKKANHTIELSKETSILKKKKNLYILGVIAFILFFTLIYPSFTPILTKYTVVKHLTDKGETIQNYDMSEISYSDEKKFYIITLTHKKTKEKRELGISTKFLPTVIEYDIVP